MTIFMIMIHMIHTVCVSDLFTNSEPNVCGDFLRDARSLYILQLRLDHSVWRHNSNTHPSIIAVSESHFNATISLLRCFMSKLYKLVHTVQPRRTISSSRSGLLLSSLFPLLRLLLLLSSNLMKLVFHLHKLPNSNCQKYQNPAEATADRLRVQPLRCLRNGFQRETNNPIVGMTAPATRKSVKIVKIVKNNKSAEEFGKHLSRKDGMRGKNSKSCQAEGDRKKEGRSC